MQGGWEQSLDVLFVPGDGLITRVAVEGLSAFGRYQHLLARKGVFQSFA